MKTVTDLIINEVVEMGLVEITKKALLERRYKLTENYILLNMSDSAYYGWVNLSLVSKDITPLMNEYDGETLFEIIRYKETLTFNETEKFLEELQEKIK